MKKIYMTPDLEVVKIETQQMLASSVKVLGKDAEEDGWAPEFNFDSNW